MPSPGGVFQVRQIRRDCGRLPPEELAHEGTQVNLEPPSGSRISVTTEGAHPLIVVPHGNGSPMRYLVGVLLLFWLGLLAVRLPDAVAALLSSGRAPGGGQAFLAFWLVAWTLCGALAMNWAYRSFRPSVPELELMPNSVKYDSGIPPPRVYLGQFPKESWKAMSQRRVRLELDRWSLQSLRLRETSSGNRLTVDADASRIDIAQSASEIERGWLHQFLAKRYFLPLTQGRQESAS